MQTELIIRCADMHTYDQITKEEVGNFLEDLTVINGKMYMGSIETAEWFVETYYKEVIDFFIAPLNIYGYDMLAKTLKLAIDKQIINLTDLLGDDEQVISILKGSGDNEIVDLLNKIHPNVKVKEDNDQFDIHRKNKIRLIDPSILYKSELVKTSMVSEKVKRMGEAAYQKSNKGTFVKVISNM